MMPPLEDIIEAFDFLDDWEDRYRYIMDLAARLEPLPDEDRVESNLVHGCQSTVWVALHAGPSGVDVRADSDSQLVKGLAALVVAAIQGQPLERVVTYDFDGLFGQLRLHEHLSPTRSNGLHGMVRQLKQRAAVLSVG